MKIKVTASRKAAQLQILKLAEPAGSRNGLGTRKLCNYIPAMHHCGLV